MRASARSDSSRHIRAHPRRDCNAVTRANSCKLLELRGEQAQMILLRDIGNRLCAGSAQIGDDLRDTRHMGRLVSLPAMRNRGEKRTVGFDEQSIERHNLRHFLQFERPWKRDDSGQREIETYIEAAL